MKGLFPCVSEEAWVGARRGKHAGLKQHHSRVKHERKGDREGDTCANFLKFSRNTIKTDEWADKPRHTVPLTKSPTQEAPIGSGPLRSARSHWASRSCSSGPRFTLISPDTLSRWGWGGGGEGPPDDVYVSPGRTTSPSSLHLPCPGPLPRMTFTRANEAKLSRCPAPYSPPQRLQKLSIGRFRPATVTSPRLEACQGVYVRLTWSYFFFKCFIKDCTKVKWMTEQLNTSKSSVFHCVLWSSENMTDTVLMRSYERK